MSTETVTTPRKPRKRSRYAARQSRAGLLLITPAAVLLIVFFFIPLGQVVWMSFFDWPLLGQPSWVGVNNYATMFDDPIFVHSLLVSGVYALVLVPLLLIIGLALALLLRVKRRGGGVFRTIYFAPVVVGSASAAYLWIYLVDPRVGLFDQLLADLGITDSHPAWLAQPDTALLSVIVMVVWKSVGFGMLLLLTGMLAIPEDVTDAARIDRANRFQTFRHITLPLLRRPIALTVVLGAVGAVLSFEQFWLLTGGGPNDQTTPVVMSIFRTSFTRFQLGMGAAMSIFLLVVVVLLSAVQLRLLRDSADD